MAIDKVVDSAALDAKFTAIANAIRAKNGATGTYTPDEMPAAIAAIPTGTNVQSKTGTFTLGAFTTGYYQRATVNCGFIPDIFVVWLSGDSYVDGNTNAWSNMGSAAFCLFGSRVQSDISSAKFSTAVNLSLMLYRYNTMVDVDIWKDSSGISTSTVFNYAAYKFT